MVGLSIDEVADRLAAGPLAARTERDRSLGLFTTYRVGGSASLFVFIDSRADVDTLVDVIAGAGVSTLVVGRGSNMLVSDSGFEGVAIVLGDGLGGLHIDDSSVRAEAAVPLPVAARASVAAGLAGFEWAVGVPGSIGGAIRMNAGGHGSDMAATVVSARVADLVTGEVREWSPAELAFGYRESAIEAHHLVIEATLALHPGSVAAGEDALSEVVRWRREHQPGGQNAGSVFTNPEGDSAGRLIDAAGGRGLRIGTAEVSTKHANFIQADPGGAADDVYAVMRAVRDLVREHHGVDLDVETRLVGFGDQAW
ncbi:MAG: UDP-N-acetylmuramate dehydrogenase [Acidimicrobiales bacterium]